MRNHERLEYMKNANEQADLPEKFFTYNNTNVVFSTGGYKNYRTTKSHSDVADKIRGSIKLFSAAGKQPAIEKFLDKNAPSSQVSQKSRLMQ